MVFFLIQRHPRGHLFFWNTQKALHLFFLICRKAYRVQYLLFLHWKETLQGTSCFHAGLGSLLGTSSCLLYTGEHQRPLLHIFLYVGKPVCTASLRVGAPQRALLHVVSHIAVPQRAFHYVFFFHLNGTLKGTLSCFIYSRGPQRAFTLHFSWQESRVL